MPAQRFRANVLDNSPRKDRKPRAGRHDTTRQARFGADNQLNWQLELGRGGAALPDRQAATGTVPPHARATAPATGDEPGGLPPVTCRPPTPDSIILLFNPPHSRLCPSSSSPFAADIRWEFVSSPSAACLPACLSIPAPHLGPPYSLLTSRSPRHSASRLDLRAGDTDNRHKEFRALAEALHLLHPS